jgi:hypothetical protein
MHSGDDATMLEDQIDQWRNYLRRRQAIHSVDVTELEDHLREQVAGLMEAGLASDEAFLVAVKRLGDLDSLSREFAREHPTRVSSGRRDDWMPLSRSVSPSRPQR